MNKMSFIAKATICLVVSSAIFSLISPNKIEASSHREAPFMTTAPKLDITDFYMFQSYDAANVAENDVNQRNTTLIMNFHPLQDAFGGPNYFFADENAAYRINIDNNGDGVEDIIFQIQFNFKGDNFRKLAVPTGAVNTEIPLIALPGVADEADANLNIVESYTLTVIKNGAIANATNLNNLTLNSQFAGTTTFVKPVDNIGATTIPLYNDYVEQHVYAFGAFGEQGKVFVGQRNDPFVVNLGEIFDGLAIADGGDAIAVKNVTSICIEVPNSFLALDGDAVTNNVFAGWATTLARGKTVVFNAVGSANLQNNGLPDRGTIFKQVSRLGMPLVNEAVIGVSFKDRFNNSVPSGDVQFADFVLNSSLAALFNIVGLTANAPEENRLDLVKIFAQGVDFPNDANGGVANLNSQVNNVFGPGVAEYQRLDVSIPPVELGNQETLGIAAGDDAGFPNGRRPGDDVVDIAVKVVGGLLADDLTDSVPTAGETQINGDAGAGALADAADVDNGVEGLDDPLGNGVVEFPFLGIPISGNP
ncbi:DUF4331 domain-containing protein [Candidatus Uabimicrobium amorphum]|uniref:DUF4331 domain-containing protein n=1 Tax=Uabimicrobium amorphum TaxID=2596890 RepID=A0A5S9F474_UABAM|nr:DUF4331 domain-containing protein [Candidatus Uabimicrobium amorphum]BBM83922.1 hypothetical protein UABAM_02277 [Candidatus Uabimicrobium amorphum]